MFTVLSKVQRTLEQYKPPFWLAVVVIALVGIVSQKVTGNGGISALMALLLFLIVFAKSVSIAFRLAAVLGAIVLVILVLAYWLLTPAGF